MSDTLIFVYNADGGILNMLKDFVHKNVSPETYPCSLCALTWDNLGMNREWKKFVDQLGRKVEFLHRDELEEKYDIKNVLLPASFVKCMDEKPELWLNAELMDSCQTLDDLKHLVTNNLN